MDYEDQLLDPRWKAKRQEIIDRDWGMCQKCMTSKNLDVHHKQYITGRMAWEYEDFYLITLCRTCHLEEHQTKEIKVGGPDLVSEAFSRIRQSVWAWSQLTKRSK